MENSLSGLSAEAHKYSQDLSAAAALHTIQDSDILINYALDTILGRLNAVSGSFFLWDEFQKELVLKAIRGPQKDRLRSIQIKLREGIIGWVGEKGDSVLVKDILADERFLTVKRPGQYKSNSFISIPLITKNKLIGVINVTEKENLISFSETDFVQAKAFAQHVADAYDNLRMSLKLKKDNEDLQYKIAALKSSQKIDETLVTVGKLSSHLAHELNNPLDAIRRYVNLALEQSMQDSLSREYLLKAKKGIRRAIHVIRGLLQLSRESQHDSSKSVEIHELISHSLTSIAEELNFDHIQLETNYEPAKIFVLDKGLELVLRNIIQNAHQSMGGKGHLWLKTSRLNGTLFIQIDDSGSGIPDHVKPRLFEPFFSTKKRDEGTGLGLAICKEIVERIGGNITCENNESGGARFILSIPCIKEGN